MLTGGSFFVSRHVSNYIHICIYMGVSLEVISFNSLWVSNISSVVFKMKTNSNISTMPSINAKQQESIITILPIICDEMTLLINYDQAVAENQSTIIKRSHITNEEYLFFLIRLSSGTDPLCCILNTVSQKKKFSLKLKK